MKRANLTATARGQVTFRKEILEHLGIKPGGKIELDLMPDGRAALRAVRPTGSIRNIFGMPAEKTTKKTTLEEIDEAIEKGWAGRL